MGFFFLFPGFLIYQALVQFSVLPPFLGGYFTLASALVFPFAIYSFSTNGGWRVVFNSKVVLGYFFLLLGILFATFFASFGGVDPGIITVTYATLLRSLVIFFVIYCFNFDGVKQKKFLIYFLLVYTLAVIIFSVDGEFVVRGLEFGGEIFQLDYQTTAVIYILMLASIVSGMEFKRRFVIYLLAVAALFNIGARSELVGLVPFVMAVELSKSKSPGLFLMKLIPVTVFLISVGYILYQYFPDGRVFGLLNLGADASAVARFEFTKDALNTIAEYPILGNFGSYIIGQYSHNILSVWVDFGLVGFLFFIFWILLQGIIYAKYFSVDRLKMDFVRSFSIFLVVIVMLVAAKNYGYPLIPVAVAYYARYYNSVLRGRLGGRQ